MKRAVVIVSCPDWAQGEHGEGNGHLRLEVTMRARATRVRDLLSAFIECDAAGCGKETVVEVVDGERAT